MEITQADILEQKLNRTVKIAIYFNSLGVIALGYLLYFEPAGYKKIGLVFSIVAFVSSIFISTLYLEAEKQIGQSRKVRPKTVARKFSEKFLLLFFPYTFWCSAGVFL